jgi:hypothetical protein
MGLLQLLLIHENMTGMRKLDWASARRYTASGSPILLLGSALILSLRHHISNGWAVGLFAVVLSIGGIQASLASKRKTAR